MISVTLQTIIFIRHKRPIQVVKAIKGVQQQCFELYCDLMEHIQFDISCCWHWDDKQGIFNISENEEEVRQDTRQFI